MLVPSGVPPTLAVWGSAALGAGSAVFYASNVVVNKFVVDAFSTSEIMFWHGVVATPFLAAFVPRRPGHRRRARRRLRRGRVHRAGRAGGDRVRLGVRRMPAAHASTLTLLEPLVSVLLGAGVLGERLVPRAIAGATPILAGPP